ncbi:hypothetical protein DL771_012348 [Monosporascus sp. 5C6A]|nr:hypothetical protein DL771_012348 [Monosporascus sp. 5C6A]
MAQFPSVSSFGAGNRGFQVAQNNGTISAAIHLPPERPETPPAPFVSIPFCRDYDFVNRGDILDQITRRLCLPPARAALVGLGGIGKSQLAIEYAYRIAEQSAGEVADTWVFWIHAGTQARVLEGFQAIADTVRLAGRKQPQADILLLVSRWLHSERSGKWMVILDGADDADVLFATNQHAAHDSRPLASYLPQSPNGSILVTTRDRDLAFRLTGRHNGIIDVGPMAMDDALALLRKKVGDESDIVASKELVEALDFVPLAVIQAAAYIQMRAPRCSVTKYLADFQRSEQMRSGLLRHSAGDLRRDGGASDSILATWQISFDYIRNKRPSAADLLSLLSFFDRHGIAESDIRYIKGLPYGLRAEQTDQTERADSGSADGSDDSSSDNGDRKIQDFEDDVAMLRNFCFISTNNAGDIFETHRLVQLSTRKWLEVHNLLEEFKAQYIKQMAGLLPTGDYENWAICQRLFTHVEEALNHRPGDEGPWLEWTRILHNGGWYAWSQGWYEVSERMVQKARRIRQKQFGQEHEATLASISLLGAVLVARGKYKMAESLHVQVMETRKRVLGKEHPSTLTSMNNLASAYRNQGRWKEAELLFMQVTEMRERVLGKEHPDTLISMNNLALTYSNQGRWKEAELPFMQVMEMRERVLGKEHPSTLISMNDLALTYSNQGRWKEAELLEVQAMETRKRILGEEHPDTLISMNNLASTYNSQGRWKEAELLFMQVMETEERVLGKQHPTTLTSMNNLASTCRDQGRWKEAELLEVQVMETKKRVLGEEHPDTLINMSNLAFTWKCQGRLGDALTLMQKCCSLQTRVLGPEHPDTASSLSAWSGWQEEYDQQGVSGTTGAVAAE